MPAAFHKVLIANRGEIACRIIAACRERGLKSVAVYSDADRDALHVQQADEAVQLGPSAPAESYLAIDKLVAAARASGARALHPGYGFRAESAELAEACAAAGLSFLGPGPAALRTMGDKRAARALAREALVPVLPGYEGPAAGAREAARQLGYPLLVKAALGGGGKGMRRIGEEAELEAALESAARVAGSAFGDASVFLERHLDEARHIEVQVLGDGRGRAVHLFERECSLQRRHQKVLEESPSPALDPELRERITAAAVALAGRARYFSAGTCEFLLGPDRSFYFLEMNTRIQVEHPVTEMTTGVDLVGAQLELALTGELPAGPFLARGHAVEVRLLAEDPLHDFLPQAGPLLRFDLPRLPFLRIDTGYAAGCAVPVEYDSLLAKIIAWGETRAQAFARLRVALDATIVHGVPTNLPFLQWLVRDERVLRGELSTSLLERELLAAAAPALRQVPPLVLAAAALSELLGGAPAAREGATDPAPDPFLTLGLFRVGGRG